MTSYGAADFCRGLIFQVTHPPGGGGRGIVTDFEISLVTFKLPKKVTGQNKWKVTPPIAKQWSGPDPARRGSAEKLKK